MSGWLKAAETSLAQHFLSVALQVTEGLLCHRWLAEGPTRLPSQLLSAQMDLGFQPVLALQFSAGSLEQVRSA